MLIYGEAMRMLNGKQPLNQRVMHNAQMNLMDQIRRGISFAKFANGIIFFHSLQQIIQSDTSNAIFYDSRCIHGNTERLSQQD
jgi:hypothetical protein